MIEVFRKLLRVKRSVEPVSFEPPVFLVGCMRSGTTFLANFMTEHPEMIRLESELNEVWTEIGGIDCVQERKYADRKLITTSATANMAGFFERCKLEFSSSRYFYWRLLNRMIKGTGGVRKSRNKSVLLNKSVHLVNRLDYVMNMFPEAKVIFIIRPIEQQVNSLKLHFEKNAAKGHFYRTPNEARDSWVSGSRSEGKLWDVEDLARKWIQLNKTAIDDLGKNEQDRSIILDYEKMVENPGEVLNQIYNFLSLSPMKVNIQNTLDDRKPFNTNTGGNPLESWKSNLSEADLALIEKAKSQLDSDYKFVETARLASR